MSDSREEILHKIAEFTSEHGGWTKFPNPGGVAGAVHSLARAALAAADPPLYPSYPEHDEVDEDASLKIRLRAFRGELTSQYGMRYEGSWLVGRLDQLLGGGLMADFAHWSCPLCDFEDSGDYVVDPGLNLRIDAHKAAHLRKGGDDPMLVAWRKEFAYPLGVKGWTA